MIDIDIDRLQAANDESKLFAVNAPGLFAFYERDHGNRQDGASLRQWAEERFATANVSLDGGIIRLVTFPRHLFYKFAPLSLWYGYGPSGDLRGILYEVNNTFGETHTYVAAASDGRNQHAADKAFHVSPFFDVTGRYKFTMRAPTDKLDVVVESSDGPQTLHMANIKARRLAVSTGALLRLSVTNPLSTLGVTLAIHLQALFLWRRGAKYRPKPDAPTTPSTKATPMQATSTHFPKDAA